MTETMHAEVGDWIVVHGPALDAPVREGQIVDVPHANHRPPYLLRWTDDDRLSLIVIRGSEVAQVRTRYVRAANPKPQPTSPWTSATKPVGTLLSTMDKPVPVVTLLAVELAALVVAAGLDRLITH